MILLNNKRVLVTGGAGFIGSHIVERLISLNNNVIIYDNLTTGKKEFVNHLKEKVELIQGDILDKEALHKAMENIDFVFHMAANADIKDNLKDPIKCLNQNTIATNNVLEAMRRWGVKNIAFASSGAIYGEPSVFPTPENVSSPIQTSIYGASKFACEGLLEAYANGYGFNVYIYRFVSLMGERYSHGCAFDFYKKLLQNPRQLEILGDGKQRKSFLYVTDAIDAMFLSIEKSNEKINIYNLGNDDFVEIKTIAKKICDVLSLKDVSFQYTGGSRGWIGDSPFVHLDTLKIKSLGWAPKYSIMECVEKTIKWIKENQWVVKK
ncbi:nucleoside-diphosphate sugar epimerase [Candidatus Woesearchaeota archaeon CG_4_10_14_0_2_um_filter_33_13]|nr:MAG: nucleoside-diphosphate sugar epimerase [Candidatus Woesearchaeota archaeon CG_4_10_14_0_2_um_filter_33_13]